MSMFGFHSSSEAYDHSQFREDIELGDILLVVREKAIAIADTWPIQITAGKSSFHELKEGTTIEGLIEDINSNKESSGFSTRRITLEHFQKAVNLADYLGFEVHPVFQKMVASANPMAGF